LRPKEVNVRRFGSARRTGDHGLQVSMQNFMEEWSEMKPLSRVEAFQKSHGLLANPTVPDKALRETPAEVYFEKMPKNYIDNKKEAQKRGLYAFYQKISRVSLFDRSAFYISLSFVPFSSEGVSDQETITKYVQKKKDTFLIKVGHVGSVAQVTLSPSVTSYFTSKHLQFSTMLFSQQEESYLKGHFALFLKTPAGFWDICWYSYYDDLIANKSAFTEIVQNIRVRTREEARLKEALDKTTTTTSTSSTDVDKATMIAKSLFAKRKKLQFGDDDQDQVFVIGFLND